MHLQIKRTGRETTLNCCIQKPSFVNSYVWNRKYTQEKKKNTIFYDLGELQQNIYLFDTAWILNAIYVQEYLKLREQKRRKDQIISPEL